MSHSTSHATSLMTCQARWRVMPGLLTGGLLALATVAQADNPPGPPWWTYDPVFTAFIRPPATPTRWVVADGVPMRFGTDPQSMVIRRLAKGDGVFFQHQEGNGDCLVRMDEYGSAGYVACRDLSADKVAPTPAPAIDPATRWVVGSAVNVRQAPDAAAAVLSRLPLNATVKLLHDNAGNGYCEVQPPDAASGFMACRYLAAAPLNVQRLSQPGNPDYDPERAFWVQPRWVALELYAVFLLVQKAGITWEQAVDYQHQESFAPNAEGPWPRNEALERMKAHLAKGIFGPVPDALTDWADTQRIAQQVADAPPGLGVRETGLDALRGRLGLYAYDTGGYLQKPRIHALVRALEFPAVKPSLFRSEKDIAPPGSDAAALSGRFGIVYRQTTQPCPAQQDPNEPPYGAGLYDMLSRTSALAQPVWRVQLMRDGRLHSQASVARQTDVLWGSTEEPYSADSEGFAFGDADPRMWRLLGGSYARQQSLQRNLIGSLFAFYTPVALPRDRALLTQTVIPMDREATGFVRGVQWHFDLDGDGVPDLAVWEGTGNPDTSALGPGPGIEQTWYRLALVNINGHWKVLGTDAFGYGGGC